jgi:two-component system response regulator QseB
VRVLIVEDDELLGAGIHDAFERAQCAVERVGDGRAALAALQAGDFDLAVLDLGLPGMDGLEVLRRLRAKGRRILCWC